MATREAAKSDITEYEVAWQYNPRLVAEHLGSQKYSSSARALGELVANEFDAGATVVDINLTTNELLGLKSIEVIDDGCGISPEVLKGRFAEIAANPELTDDARSTFGKFGVGRLAVFRVGSLSEWRTVSARQDGERIECTFTLKADERKRDVTLWAMPLALILVTAAGYLDDPECATCHSGIARSYQAVGTSRSSTRA